jgi:putative sigma-54 modulation protein
LQITITSKHFEITEAIRKHAEEKVEKLPRYYDSIIQIEVIISGNEGLNPGVEVIVRAKHNQVFVSSETGNDILSCVDLAVHKIESQLRKAKSRERDNKYPPASEPE